MVDLGLLLRTGFSHSGSTQSVRNKLIKVGVCPIGPLPVLVASLPMLGSVAALLLA